MIMNEKTIERNVIYKGNVLEYVVDTVELENKIQSTREMVLHPGGVGVIAIDKDGFTYLVSQYRKPFEKTVLEIPAGKLDKGEDTLKCGLRELKEETGLVADNLISLGEIYPSVGYTNEIIYIYLATEFTIDSSDPDEDEFVDVIKMEFSKLADMVMSGEVKDAKTVAAVLKAKFYLENK